MTKWLLILEQQYSENTREYGFGDYPARIPYIACVVEAETERKAQNAAKKIFPRIRFGGVAGYRMVEATSEDAKIYIAPADRRLGPRSTELHNKSLAML